VVQQQLRAGTAEGWFWLWDAYILAVYGIALFTTFDDPHPLAGRQLGAAGALTGLVLWYLLFGRRLIKADNEGWPAHVFILGALLLFGAEVVSTPVNPLGLFMVYPMIFMVIPLRMAVPVVIAASLVQTGVMLAHHVPRDLLIPPVVGMVISILMGTFIDRTSTVSQQRADLIERLEASRAEVARLSRAAGTATERARLAREIHDTLAQGFTSIITLVQAAESELDGDGAKVRRHLAVAVRTARENLDEARTLVAALTPSALDTGTLDDAIRRQVERLAEETGIVGHYRTVGAIGELPTAVEVVLLRAVQEALSNVRKHAGAASVTVVLRLTPDAVALTVSDDGVGFATAGAGFGLSGMRTRVEQVSGRLVVHSVPGTGTRLELEVPR
jgi:signal transduction histidine kinase